LPPTVRNLRLDIAYDGTHYYGYQKQPGVRTVQSALEHVLTQWFGPVHLVAAGRTDTGVHAHQQVINFQVNTAMPLPAIQKQLLNWRFHDILIRSVTAVDPSFHARYSAQSRVYRYYFSDQQPSLWASRYVAALPSQDTDIATIQAALPSMIGEHDFYRFCRSGSSSASTRRRVLAATCWKDGAYWCIEIEANGFLYGMVRNLIGAIFELIYQRKTLADFKDLFTNDRTIVYNYKPVPAKGLTLYQVRY
jgi:tRNA pseudouridine38-40 synthase